MHRDSRNLMSAVSMAIDRELDVKSFDDRLAMQKGCYILNSWGYGPKYRYSLFIKGPYSSELADDCYELCADASALTDVSSEDIAKLSDLFAKGLPFIEAYATVMLVKENNPGRSSDDIRNTALSIKPHLRGEVMEASAMLLDRASASVLL